MLLKYQGHVVSRTIRRSGMDGSKPEVVTQSRLKRFFPPLACTLVITGILATAYLIDKSVQAGGFLWWPYPALALLYAAILAANWLIERDGS